MLASTLHGFMYVVHRPHSTVLAHLQQIAKFAPLGHTLQANDNADADPETKQKVKDWQSVEEIVKSDDIAFSDSLQEPADLLHIVGDII